MPKSFWYKVTFLFAKNVSQMLYHFSPNFKFRASKLKTKKENPRFRFLSKLYTTNLNVINWKLIETSVNWQSIRVHVDG